MKTTTTLSEMQQRNVDAAVRLVRLSASSTRAVIDLLSALALALLDLGKTEGRAAAAAIDSEQVMLVRLQYNQAAARLMLESARRMVELGNEARIAFSRQLTEQLASGNHELMDAFQSFFSVLPVRNADLVEVFRLALDRTERSLGEIDAVLDQAKPGTQGRVAAKPRSARGKLSGNATAAEPVSISASAGGFSTTA